jgi:hypothetical protein
MKWYSLPKTLSQHIFLGLAPGANHIKLFKVNLLIVFISKTILITEKNNGILCNGLAYVYIFSRDLFMG